MMEKRKCSWRNCKTVIDVNTSFEKSAFAKRMGVEVSGWCKIHTNLYNKQCDAFEKLVDQYNKKQIIDKFGRIIKFTHHSDVSNYLYLNDMKEYKRILKGVGN